MDFAGWARYGGILPPGLVWVAWSEGLPDLNADALFEAADRAVDARDWAEVERLAGAILAIDPTLAEAAGLLAMAQRRLQRLPVDQGFDAERRVVTVAFCDLADSSRLTALLDLDEQRELLGWWHRVIAAAVGAEGGHVAAFLGDGAMLLFGYPRASSEAPRQALVAALAILEKLRSRRDDLMRSYGVVVEARVGVHTGLAVITAASDGRAPRMPDIVGETPNIAARLEGLARPGSVLASAATCRLAGDGFRALPRGALTLKGFAEPLEAVEIAGREAKPGTAAAPANVRGTPLFGRQAEQAALETIAAEVRGGTGRVALIVGEPGIGKSRLLEAMADRVTADWRQLSCSCAAHLQTTPLLPVQALLVPDGTVTLHEALAIHRDAFDSSSAEREAVLEAAIGRLLGDACDGPTAILVEDLHWADPSTLELVGRIAERIERFPVLLAATLRPELAPAWFAAPAVRRLDLAPLGRADVARMVALGCQGDVPAAALVDWVLERTTGVPLFVEELIRYLQDAGRLLPGMAEPACADDIPPTLRGILGGRLDRLGPAKPLAQIASVIGRRFDLELLARVAGFSPERLARDLDELLESGLVERLPEPGRLLFKHALIRDAAYESMLRATARRLHSAIADALVELQPALVEAHPEIAGGHLLEARRHGEALAMLERAARAAAARSAHVEAVAHAELALGAVAGLELPAERDEKELRIRLVLGPSLIASRGYGAAAVAASYGRARELSAARPDGAERAATLRGLTVYHLITHQLSEAESLAATFLELGRASGDADRIRDGQAWLGTVRFFLGNLDDAEPLLVEALANARVEGPATRALEPPILAGSHLVWLRWLRGAADDAKLISDRLQEHAAAFGDPISRSHGMTYAAGLAVFLGEHDRARVIASELVNLANVARLPHYAAYAEIFLGAATADPRAAATAIEAGLAHRLETGAKLALPMHHGFLAEAYLQAGRLDHADREVAAGLEVAKRSGDRWWVPELYRLKGVIAHGSGAANAEVAFSAGRRIAVQTGAWMLERRIAASVRTVLGMAWPNGSSDLL